MRKGSSRSDGVKVFRITLAILILILVGLGCFGIYYAVNNKNSYDEITSKYSGEFTGDKTAIDALEQPKPKVEVNLESLPDTDSNLTEITFNTMTKLFKTSKKSILVIEKADCEACQTYEPNLNYVLKELDIKAYKIDLYTLSTEEMNKLNSYVNFNGTPYTFIIENGQVKHSYAGIMDQDTTAAFIDYFYLRNN